MKSLSFIVLVFIVSPLWADQSTALTVRDYQMEVSGDDDEHTFSPSCCKKIHYTGRHSDPDPARTVEFVLSEGDDSGTKRKGTR